jgi:hypothetical protein
MDGAVLAVTLVWLDGVERDGEGVSIQLKPSAISRDVTQATTIADSLSASQTTTVDALTQARSIEVVAAKRNGSDQG